MNSLKKMAEVASRFERKLAEAPKVQESDLTAALVDAIFDPKFAERDQGFMNAIMRPDSNFQAAAGNVSGKITIGITVDAPAKTADFTVSVPGARPEQIAAIKDALKKDYSILFNKADVLKQFQDRLAKGMINPPNLKGAIPLKTV